MNKIRGRFLLMMIALVFMIIPTSIQAKTTNGSKKCKNRVGISFSVSAYSRSAGYSNGTYTNTVGDRTISISGGSGYKYNLIVYTGDIGDLEDLENFKNSTVRGTKGVSREESTFTGSTTVTVAAGKEVLVVVTLSDSNTTSPSTNCDSGKHVKTTDSNGKDSSYCCTGVFDKSASTSDSVDIGGVAATKFVQNPGIEDGLYVANLRKAGAIEGTACTNAKAGIGTGSYKNYSLEQWNGDKDTWQSKYYSKLLSYCELATVPFNLDEDSIENISNRLLELYYRSEQLTTKSTSSLTEINEEINNLKNNLPESNYYIIKADGSTEGNSDVLGSSLSCEFQNNIHLKADTVSTSLAEYNTGSGQEEYLYAESKAVTANIKTKKHPKKGEPITVCKTTCYEHLTVVYSPPQVVKAGLCFQYRVTIKSETNCGVQISNFLDKLNQKEMCSPNPVCEDDEKKTQAGPSEEFDECVNSCDGGDYSQSCINKCYKKVYSEDDAKKITNSNVNLSDRSSSTTVTISDLINNTFDSSNLTTNVAYTKSDLKNYYNEPYNKCTTSYIQTHQNYSECGEYYFKAKTLYPMGEYECNSNGKCSWNKDSSVNSMEDKYLHSSSIESIGMQIARSSPFYVRSATVATDLIMNLINANGNNSRKYYISNSGIKIQTSKTSSWVCTMSCSFYGCTSSDALTSDDYTSSTEENLKNINEALNDCNSSAACETSDGTTETTFEINVTTEREDVTSEETVTGSNTLGSTTGDSTNNVCTSEQATPSMFVPAYQNDSTATGIFGLCYDGQTAKPQYQTTITFPGSWINLKTGEVSYDCESLTTYRSKEQYYCTPYDAKDVNTAWWKWAVNDEFNQSAYPSSFSPDTWNITAQLGTEDEGFGKYRWHIGFQCFYALYNKTGDDDTQCYRGNSGTAENCVDDSGKTIEEESTKTNYDIRVAATDNLFPNNRLRGYNWGSAAQLKSNDSAISTALNATGYGVDPVKYSKEVLTKGDNIYDSDADLIIKLSSDDISKLKSQDLEFEGSYKEVSNIPGLYYYTMTNTFKSLLGSVDWTNWDNIRGKNSQTAISVSK